MIVKNLKKRRISYKIRNKFSNPSFDSCVYGNTSIGYLPQINFINIEHMGSEDINNNLKYLGFPTIPEIRDIYDVDESGVNGDGYYSIHFRLNMTDEQYKSLISKTPNKGNIIVEFAFGTIYYDNGSFINGYQNKHISIGAKVSSVSKRRTEEGVYLVVTHENDYTFNQELKYECLMFKNKI